MGRSHNKNGRRKDPKRILGGKFQNTRLVAKQKTRQEDVFKKDAVQILEHKLGGNELEIEKNGDAL